MKKAKTYLFNSFAAILFATLLAVNVQVGSGNSFLGIGDSYVNEAKAGPIICIPWTYTCANIGNGDYVIGIRIPIILEQ